MLIKVFGMGCKSCGALHDNTLAALKKLGRDDQVEYITDIVEVAKCGALEMPALMLDGKLVSKGKVLTVDEIANLIKD